MSIRKAIVTSLIAPAFAISLSESLIPPLRGAVDVSPVAESMIDQIGILGAACLARLIHGIK